MIRFFYLVIIFSFTNSLNAKNVSCEFEEVYEYYNVNLYTLLYLNKKMYMANNSERNKIQLLHDNNDLIPELIDIYSNYPDIKSNYKFKNYDIKIEKNRTFIKRLVIKSSEINLSIYLINCNFNSIEKKYLNFNPILPYVFN